MLSAGPEYVYIFPHVPRTGGDSLHRTFTLYYRPVEFCHSHLSSRLWHKLRRRGAADFQRLKYVAGHGAYYGLHNYIPKPCKYFVMVRDPLRRAISLYYYYLSRPDSAEAREINSKCISLEQFVLGQVNVHASYITGFPHHRKLAPTVNEWSYIKEILDQQFVFVGLTKKYYESCFLLARTLGLSRNLFGPRTHRAVQKSDPEDLAPGTVNSFRAINDLDYRILEYTQERFEAQLQALSVEQQKSLECYVRQARSFTVLEQEVSDLFELRALARLFSETVLRVVLISCLQNDGMVERIEYLLNLLVEKHNARFEISAVKNYAVTHDQPLRLKAADDIADIGSADLLLLLTLPGEDYIIKRSLAELEIPEEKIEFLMLHS